MLTDNYMSYDQYLDCADKEEREVIDKLFEECILDALRILSSKGAKAPSLPNKDLPDFNCSRALFLILSKSNSSFIKKTVLVKLILFLFTDTV